jgi:hypothetical protein
MAFKLKTFVRVLDLPGAETKAIVVNEQGTSILVRDTQNRFQDVTLSFPKIFLNESQVTYKEKFRK